MGFGGLFEDLPRNLQGVAIIGDPRNDENLMLSQFHAAFLKFHNAAVDWVKARNGGLGDHKVFKEAHRLTRWHYQWMIVHEFLPLFIGQQRTSDILNRGRRFYWPQAAFIPLEFSGAAYRFGYSMIRPSYRANRTGNPGTDPGAPAFFGMIFDPAGEGKVDPVDLRGGALASGLRVKQFLAQRPESEQGAKRSDGKRSGPGLGNSAPSSRITARRNARSPIRDTHRGSGHHQAAPTGRIHDRSRLDADAAKNSLPNGDRPYMTANPSRS